MVRRRARAAKMPTVVACEVGTVAVTNVNLFEDQYFASPKRKDCKVEQKIKSNADPTNTIAVIDGATKVDKSTTGAIKTKAERGNISGRVIGVPLATRSQTRTIENFFKANTGGTHVRSDKLGEKNVICHPPSKLSNGYAPMPAVQNVQTDLVFDLSEDTNDTDNTELSDEVAGAGGIDFGSHRSALRDSRSSASSGTDNIFLQEPVLRLEVDKTPNQASSIKIKKSLEIEPIFSSPPSLTAVALNGRFNQIVSLNGTKSPPNDGDCFGFNVDTKIVANLPNGLSTSASGSGSATASLPDNDNSSCDSGVALTNSLDSANSCSSQQSSSAANATLTMSGAVTSAMTPAQTRRRKPATPHRILCPSPIKSPARVVTTHVLSPAGKKAASSAVVAAAAAVRDHMPLSPRKSHRQMVAASSKTRRRLNQQKEQAPYNPTIAITAPTVSMTNKTKTQQNGYTIKATTKQVSHNTHCLNFIEQQLDSTRFRQCPVASPLQNGLLGYGKHETSDVRDADEDLDFENFITDNDIAEAVDIAPLSDPKLPMTDECKAVATSPNAISTAIGGVAQSSPAHPNANANASVSVSVSVTLTALATRTDRENASSTMVKAPKSAAVAVTATSAASVKSKHQVTQLLANAHGNRELTEFFPVRRSVRKTKSAVKEEMMRNLEKAILEERQDGLRVSKFEGKGRGVVADRRFQRGEFVVEYIGDLISMTEAAEREKRYALDENAGCYMYYFKHKNQQYCIDATIDTGKFGRLVNHSRNGNLVTKVVVVKQRPHLILIAKDDIEPGEELCYDYGDRSKESLLHHPWLAF